jgi:hypothetical protein
MTFCHKIMRGKILSKFNSSLEDFEVKYNLRKGGNCSTDYIYKIPESSTKAGAKRLTIFLPKCLNRILRFSFHLSESDFKTFIKLNISNLYLSFQRILNSSYSEIGEDEEAELEELNEFED